MMILDYMALCGIDAMCLIISVAKVAAMYRTDGQFRCFYSPMYRGLSIHYACKTSWKKRFTSQTPAAHCTYNYCPTKVREAIKVLSCRAQFNVCRESLRVHFLSALPRSSWNACGYKFIQTAAPGWAFSRKHILMNS